MNSIIGIVAEKLGHSLSPYIHNYWSKKYKQKLQYQKFEISEKNLTKFFQNIEGSFYNIIGLDIIKFLRNLKSI